MDNSLLNIKININNTKNIINDVNEIINKSRKIAYQAIDIVLLQRNWLIGKRIYEEEIKDTRQENYGLEIIKVLSNSLTENYGKGFSKSNLYSFYRFYKEYQNIFQSVIGKSLNILSWTHYSVLLSVTDLDARKWYEKEAYESRWSVRALQRNIDTQYYYRLMASQVKEPVINEMNEKTKEYQQDKLEHIKNPIILEFLGLNQSKELLESDLESAIITNLQKVLMELGKGYAFIGRQYHIHTDESDYYVDLVFYNYLLKCFVLIDLKTNKITHQDVGQMDMYVRMFDDLIKQENDNPTLGIVLCSQTSKDIAKYSILKGNEQLFATKYKLYLPSEDNLRAEIEHQKSLYSLRKKNEEIILS